MYLLVFLVSWWFNILSPLRDLPQHEPEEYCEGDEREQEGEGAERPCGDRAAGGVLFIIGEGKRIVHRASIAQNLAGYGYEGWIV